MSGRAGALLRGVVAAIVLVSAGCVPVGGPPDFQGRKDTSAQAVASVPFEAANGAFTIDLPAGWYDLTAEYTELVPDTVLGAVWSTGPELGAPLTPFATVSSGRVAPGHDIGREVDEDLESWAQEMTDPVQGVGAGFETEAGGRGMWRTVRGNIEGLDTTIYSIHIIDGSTKMMVLIETYLDITEPPEALIDALKTVRFPDVA